MNAGQPAQPVVPPSIDGVTLDDCAAEPIHTPGHIQPHGVLVALDAQLRVRGWSANAALLPDGVPTLDQPADGLGWPAELMETLREVRDDMVAGDGGAPMQLVEGALADYDTVVHAHQGRVLVEFERSLMAPSDRARFIARSQRVLDVLRRRSSMEALLNTAVQELRALTGFDRVMAYRFRHDDSGDVMAEARREDLEPLLGMRYPASDIPAQARRMYLLSTLRLIADVEDAPVPVLGHPEDPPLDMTYGVLRSVSPIHVEYLRNMGVRASMSISIVVDGRLWGLVACHHYADARRIPYALRAVCDLLAQVLAAQVARLESSEREAAATQAAQARARIAEALQAHDDLLAGLTPMLDDVSTMLGADGVIVMQGAQRLIVGPSAAEAAALVAALGPAEHWVERSERAQWPAASAEAIGPWVGLLAIRFDPAGAGWVLALRREQEQTVRWGGSPEKTYAIGPRGPRLSPRGSFAEWRETVRGAARPWTDAERTAARHLQSDLQREMLSRHADLDRARTQMLAMLGHDLRDPLNTISMAAGALERGADDGTQQRIGARIRSSSGRMARLVTHLLDLSRIRSGRGLDVRPAEGDVVALLRDLADESRVAHPGSALEVQVPETLRLRFDADRLAQAVGNLLSNARHHGDPMGAIRLRAHATDDGRFAIEVRNVAAPLPEALRQQLFQAFKRKASDAPESGHRGLGLGLYIAHAIATEHGGSLDYDYEAPEVVFRLVLPSG